MSLKSPVDDHHASSSSASSSSEDEESEEVESDKGKEDRDDSHSDSDEELQSSSSEEEEESQKEKEVESDKDKEDQSDSHSGSDEELQSSSSEEEESQKEKEEEEETEEKETEREIFSASSPVDKNTLTRKPTPILTPHSQPQSSSKAKAPTGPTTAVQSKSVRKRLLLEEDSQQQYQNKSHKKNRKSKDGNGNEKEDMDIDRDGPPVQEKEKEKSGLFVRLWSEADEIVLLKGMLKYSSKKGVSPYENMGAFYDFIKESLEVNVSKRQLTDKIWRLMKKYKNNAKRGKNGNDPYFSRPHERKSFEISKKIWGGGSGVITINDDHSNNTDNKNSGKWRENLKQMYELHLKWLDLFQEEAMVVLNRFKASLKSSSKS